MLRTRRSQRRTRTPTTGSCRERRSIDDVDHMTSYVRGAGPLTVSLANRLLIVLLCACSSSPPSPSAENGSSASLPPIAADAQGTKGSSSASGETSRPAAPPAPSPQSPPAAVAAYLRAQASSSGRWSAFVFELGPASDRNTGPRRFLGYRVLRSKQVPEKLATELVGRLGEDTSYADGDYGCVTEPFGVRVSHGATSLDFLVNCGHISFDREGSHDGPVLSSEMVTFLEGLRGR
jgi:hypothetical protein